MRHRLSFSCLHATRLFAFTTAIASFTAILINTLSIILYIYIKNALNISIESRLLVVMLKIVFSIWLFITDPVEELIDGLNPFFDLWIIWNYNWGWDKIFSVATDTNNFRLFYRLVCNLIDEGLKTRVHLESSVKLILITCNRIRVGEVVGNFDRSVDGFEMHEKFFWGPRTLPRFQVILKWLFHYVLNSLLL